MDNSPIGVFDSGMGGLSVWRELRVKLPCESLVYYGDGANCPYGEKPAADVLTFIEDGVRRLLDENVKLIVLACNTATMAAVKYLRGKYDVPFVGMEPALKPAVGSTKSGVVGVLATHATLDSEWFAELKEKYAFGAGIVVETGEGFVEAVEAGQEDAPETKKLIDKAVRPLIEAGADRIVLGCTHYPFLIDQIEAFVNSPDIEIINPAPAIARRVETLLDEYSMRAPSDNEPFYKFLSAAGEEYVMKLKEKAVSAL